MPKIAPTVLSVFALALYAAASSGMADRASPTQKSRAASVRCETCSPVDALWRSFVNPPGEAKPWSYWWWINGHVDRETVTADLEAMKRLGFGGVLLFDSRGYFDDGEHVRNPPVALGWGTEPWYDMVEFAIRECARLGLEFTMNASASGGTLNGFLDGKEYETDVLDRREVKAHLDRSVGPLLKRVPDLVGKTFTHIYSPSYEGNVKTGGSWRTIKDTFYATLRNWALSHGLKLYSESGGPWGWGSKSVPLDCDQLDMLAHNDTPQGEFWPLKEKGFTPDAGHANKNGRYFQRAIVLAARREGRQIVSMEAFTHMHRHYSVDPAFLKPLADIAFADGANRLVWHTFTCSPKRFGIPGVEYFAGSHVNRHVTWHKDAGGFVQYLARCQAMLQRGAYVDDGAFVDVATNYYSWGRYRKDEHARFAATHRRDGDVDFFFVSGEGKGALLLNTPVNARKVELWDPLTGKAETLAALETADGKTRVELDLPVGGSAFVVLGNGERRTQSVARGQRTEKIGQRGWEVSFAYHDGIKAAPPAPVGMKTLRDWTTYGEEGKADAKALRYFSGTGIYRTVFECKSMCGRAALSLGELPSGLARVFVNGKDCGTVWCAPWTADVSSAVKPGENEVEIRYTNNWYNRLVGDCFASEASRVTRTNLRYWQGARKSRRVCTGPSSCDPLQASGLLGPVNIVYSGGSPAKE